MRDVTIFHCFSEAQAGAASTDTKTRMIQECYATKFLLSLCLVVNVAVSLTYLIMIYVAFW